MSQTLPQSQLPAVAAAPIPGRDLPVNDPPPADGSQAPVQDPPAPQQEPNPAATSTDDLDEDWAEDLNPEAHESAV